MDEVFPVPDDADPTSTQGPRWTAAIGIVSILIGVVAFPISWLPLINILGIPLSLLGLLLAIIGGILCTFLKGSGITLNIIGGSLCATALLIAISMTASMVKYSREKAAADAAAAAAATNSDGETSAPSDIRSAAPVAETAVLGEIEVKIVHASMEKVRRDASASAHEPGGGNMLSIGIEVSNTSLTKDAEYKTWGPPTTPEREAGVLKDKLDNTYKGVSSEADAPIEGRVEHAPLPPGGQISDVLIFELPADAAGLFYLDLPGRNVGEDGHVLLKLDLNHMQADH